MMKKSKYLQKPKIFPETPEIKNIDILDLINYYSASGAYNGGRLAKACKIYEKMRRALSK